jgi:hypothetical protein
VSSRPTENTNVLVSENTIDLTSLPIQISAIASGVAAPIIIPGIFLEGAKE